MELIVRLGIAFVVIVIVIGAAIYFSMRED